MLRQWLRIRSPLSVVTQGTHEIVARFSTAVNIFNKKEGYNARKMDGVKKKMLEMAQERSSNTDSELINLPTDPTEIEENLATDTLICMIGYEDYDYVISAKDFQKINWQFR